MQLNYPDHRVMGRALDKDCLKQIACRILARLVLCCYLLTMLRPAMPVVTDMLAHSFWKAAHMRVVHRINGKQHVHYELCRVVKDNQKEKGSGKSKFAVEDAACLLPAAMADLPVYAHCQPAYRAECSACADAPAVPDYKPPRVVIS